MTPPERPARPSSNDEWVALELEIMSLFDGAPVAEEDLFAGRAVEVLKILQSVMSRSKHVVLHGEKGVGKTSLSNVFWKRYNKTLQSFVVARVQASPADNFSSLWIRALEELRAAGIATGKSHYVDFDTQYEVITPSHVRRELQKCGANALPIIIIDEYNEVVDEEARMLTAKLIKEFYDFSVSTTTIIVGVGDNVEDLIGDHPSLDRALVQVPLLRMSQFELREIITTRIKRTTMKFDSDAMWTIVVLSRGLPYFTQMLAKHAAIHAIQERRIEISNDDVEASLQSFIDESEQLFKTRYRSATKTNQESYLEQSLLACALAITDDEGYFSAKSVVEPYSRIMGDKRRIAHFEKHLRRFSSDEGGNVLTKRGGERQITFRFADPMMQPYVIIRGIRSGMIDDAAKSSLLQHEQGFLPM